MTDTPDPAAFVARWAASQAAERANYQTFLAELCDVLGVPRPEPTTGEAARDGYVFDRAVPLRDTAGGPAGGTTGYADLYRRGHFVLETKQGADADAPTRKAGHGRRGSPAWERALVAAKGQAQRYAQNLGPDEPVPPFLVVCDVGFCLDLYADFSGSGRLYTPFPDARSHRLPLADLAAPGRRGADARETLGLVWTDPHALDPTRRQARVTRALAAQLGRFAALLEGSVPEDQRPEVPRFVTRCLFCLFAEDAGLVPERGFSRLLASYRDYLAVLPDGLAAFFRTMDAGGFSPDLKATLRRFNGDLFKDAAGTEGRIPARAALPLTLEALDLLLEAGRADWRQVEPAIFGTLLERALSPADRHKLGAHFTPRAYVERLVLPAVIEPLRAEWEAAQAAVALVEQGAEGRAATTEKKAAQAGRATRGRALAELQAFQRRLAAVRVLDPACGSGNFLYVTLDHLKRLEAEVGVALERYGVAGLELETAAVTPANLLGLEVNPQAAALADLVLWIGYLQGHLRTYGSAQTLAEPILQAYGNVRAEDAVLAPGPPVPRVGPGGELLTRWDGHTTRTHPATGREVPDETARVPVMDYPHARPAGPWPRADFIVGNPPFIGSQMMRDALGDGYAEALRKAYPHVPGSADFVAFWWERAALAVRRGEAERFGFITTNSIAQTFNRRVVERHLSAPAGDPDGPPLALAYAVPDHPWVDAADGAAVRVAFTVGAPAPPGDGPPGTLARVTDEAVLDEDDAHVVVLEQTRGRIHADLTTGTDLTQAAPLRSNARLSFMGVKLVGAGFVVTEEEARALGLGRVPGLDAHVRPFRNGRDLTARPRGALALDFFGLAEAEVRERFPEAYQHLLTTVKPEREAKRGRTKDSTDYADRWLEHAKPRPALRAALAGLPRYIATSEVAKHRLFAFLDGAVLPDGALISVASADAYHLGVLSSRVHTLWALSMGGRMGVGNDPRYNSTRCFETFPFPEATEAQAEAVRALGEALDAHRKARQAEHPPAADGGGLGLTDLYNVVEALRAGRALTPKEQGVHDAGLASSLLDLHERLDRAVLEAYGWPGGLTDADVLARLAALNAERRAEEKAGTVRHLRPAFQDPRFQASGEQGGLALASGPARAGGALQAPRAPRPWPAALAARTVAVRDAVAEGARTAEAVAARFQGARRADIADVLEALAELGLVRAEAAADGGAVYAA